MRGRTKEDFWSLVDRSGGPDACWPWKGVVHSSGTGIFNFEGHSISAHRHAYTLTYGDVPKQKLVIRTCSSASCCNPAHLVVGPRGDQSRHAQNTKLTWEIVRELRRAWHAREANQRELAKRFGISQPSVSQLVNNVTWREEEPPCPS